MFPFWVRLVTTPLISPLLGSSRTMLRCQVPVLYTYTYALSHRAKAFAKFVEGAIELS